MASQEQHYRKLINKYRERPFLNILIGGFMLVAAFLILAFHGMFNVFNMTSIPDQQASQQLKEVGSKYNQAIQKGQDRSMESILNQSEKQVTATIFLGDLPTSSKQDDQNNQALLEKFDKVSIPHNWMFPNQIASRGVMRWDRSDNTKANQQMYQDLDMPSYTSQSTLKSHDEESNSPTCNFAYEIVLWSHRQPIAVYQCTTDIGGAGNHVNVNYPAAMTILSQQVDPNTGKKFTYRQGIATFLRNKGDQEKFQSVSTYYHVGTQRPDLTFIKTNITNDL